MKFGRLGIWLRCASWAEPYWWSNLVRTGETQIIWFGLTTSVPPNESCRLWQLFVGPLKFTVGWQRRE